MSATVENLLYQVLNSLADFRAETRLRFEQVDQRFERVEKHLEEHDRRFEQIDSRFEQIDSRFDSLETEMRQGFQEIHVELGQINRLLDVLEDKVVFPPDTDTSGTN